MRAFVEVLAGIVRVGTDCRAYAKPFDYAVAFSSVDGKTATIKALASDDAGFTVGHARAVIRALKDAGLQATWERMK
jgi:uncharacterized membrane protein